MLFLFAMWAADYYGGQDYGEETDSSYSGYNRKSLDDADDDFSSSTSSAYSSDTTSKSEKNYAKGKIPAMVSHRLSELFSVSKIRHLLNIPDTVEGLQSPQWNIARLSENDIYTQKSKAIESAVKNLCGLVQEKDSGFCNSNMTLVERVVVGTFHDVKTIVLTQLLKFIQSVLKEEAQKLAKLKQKEASIQQQSPQIRRQMLENKARVREQERELDKKIRALKEQLTTKQYSDENDRQYDKENLADLNEQKSLLLIEPAHVHHGIVKQTKALKEIKKRKHGIQADIQKFKTMSQKLSNILQERESSTDLEDAWNEINTYFEKFEKAKQMDKQLEEEKARKLAEKSAKETADEEKEQTQEMGMFTKLEGKVSTPEAEAEAQKTGGLFDQFFKGISAGG